MKKIITTIVSIFLIMSMIQAQDIKLPKPKKEGGMPLMEALQKRATNRDYSSKMLSDQQLADLLCSARNCQEIDIYVFMDKGVFLYVPEKDLLKQVVKEDKRKMAPRQPFAAEAPVLLVFVANYDKMTGMDKEAKEFYGATDAGYVSQNVYLYCASEGLSTVVLGSIFRDEIKDLLKFNGKAVLGQPVGFAK